MDKKAPPGKFLTNAEQQWYSMMQEKQREDEAFEAQAALLDEEEESRGANLADNPSPATAAKSKASLVSSPHRAKVFRVPGSRLEEQSAFLQPQVQASSRPGPSLPLIHRQNIAVQNRKGVISGSGAFGGVGGNQIVTKEKKVGKHVQSERPRPNGETNIFATKGGSVWYKELDPKSGVNYFVNEEKGSQWLVDGLRPQKKNETNIASSVEAAVPAGEGQIATRNKVNSKTDARPRGQEGTLAAGGAEAASFMSPPVQRPRPLRSQVTATTIMSSGSDGELVRQSAEQSWGDPKGATGLRGDVRAAHEANYRRPQIPGQAPPALLAKLRASRGRGTLVQPPSYPPQQNRRRMGTGAAGGRPRGAVAGGADRRGPMASRGVLGSSVGGSVGSSVGSSIGGGQHLPGGGDGIESVSSSVATAAAQRAAVAKAAFEEREKRRRQYEDAQQRGDAAAAIAAGEGTGNWGARSGFDQEYEDGGEGDGSEAPPWQQQEGEDGQWADDDAEYAWEQLWDDEVGSYYYYNRRTGEASWIPPDGFDAGGG